MGPKAQHAWLLPASHACSLCPANVHHRRHEYKYRPRHPTKGEPLRAVGLFQPHPGPALMGSRVLLGGSVAQRHMAWGSPVGLSAAHPGLTASPECWGHCPISILSLQAGTPFQFSRIPGLPEGSGWNSRRTRVTQMVPDYFSRVAACIMLPPARGPFRPFSETRWLGAPCVQPAASLETGHTHQLGPQERK